MGRHGDHVHDCKHKFAVRTERRRRRVLQQRFDSSAAMGLPPGIWPAAHSGPQLVEQKLVLFGSPNQSARGNIVARMSPMLRPAPDCRRSRLRRPIAATRRLLPGRGHRRRCAASAPTTVASLSADPVAPAIVETRQPRLRYGLPPAEMALRRGSPPTHSIGWVLCWWNRLIAPGRAASHLAPGWAHRTTPSEPGDRDRLARIRSCNLTRTSMALSARPRHPA